MLSKQKRLSRQHIQEYLIRAKRVTTPHFNVIWTDKIPNGPRVGFSVSKKVAKTAVVRNRLRRHGYASVDPLLKKIPPNRAFLIVFLKQPQDDSVSALTKELEKGFTQGRIW